MKCGLRPETTLTIEQATLIKRVLELYLRKFHSEGKERGTDYDYFKMIYDGLCTQNKGTYRIYTDEAADIAKVIHAFNPTANDKACTDVENYLLSQKINE